MKRAALALLVLSLVGCSWAGQKVDQAMEKRADRLQAKAEATGARVIEPGQDVTLFSGVVAQACRSLEVRAEGGGEVDGLVAELEGRLSAVYGARNLAEAEARAAEAQELLPELKKARSFGGVHGGCMLLVSVKGDQTVAGQLVPRKVLCPVGEIEASCRSLQPGALVNFEGQVVGDAHYLARRPLGGG
jgi:hypothetical protein